MRIRCGPGLSRSTIYGIGAHVFGWTGKPHTKAGQWPTHVLGNCQANSVVQVQHTVQQNYGQAAAPISYTLQMNPN